MSSHFLSQDESEDGRQEWALNGRKDIASFEGASLSMYSAYPRSHLQLVRVFLGQSAHQNLKWVTQMVRNSWWRMM